MAKPLNFTATTTLGGEEALAAELRSFGIQRVVPARGHVKFMGKLSDGYRACMWSRVASRVLLTVGRFEATDAQGLYDGIRSLSWSDHVAPSGTLWIDFQGRSQEIRDTRFGAQRVKDAICDHLRDAHGDRPSVSQDRPDMRLRVHLRDGLVTVMVDLSGDALHRRKDKRLTGTAPLKRTLAAAALWYMGWPKRAATGCPLHDPMCGAGTILVEAGSMARDLAPGLGRAHWGFTRWRGHVEAAWQPLVDEALARREAGRATPIHISGADASASVLRKAEENLSRAKLDQDVHLSRCTVDKAQPRARTPGLVLTNPPYGRRIGDEAMAKDIHRALGDALRQRFLGWSAGILTDHALVGSIGLKPTRRIPLMNGPVDCRLVTLEISTQAPKRQR
jgi:23S rRNA (guanine2445-N2)-methyltransferase / 23S rRNA (guanine2069-N7)-methyltransferase